LPAVGPAIACWSASARRQHPALIRYARRVADRLHAPWTAIYVETARTARLNDSERDRIADYLRLAERSEPRRSRFRPQDRRRGHRLRRGEQHHPDRHRQIDRPRWFEILHGSVVHDLVRKSGPISVHVVSAAEAEPVSPNSPAPRRRSGPVPARAYAGAAGAVVVALGLGSVIERFIGLQSISLVFLMAVLASAIAWGCGRHCSPAC